PVIEKYVRRTVREIHSHPLKELVGAVVHWIIVDAECRTPRFAMVGGGRAKHVDIAVPVIAPRHVESSAFRATARVDGNFGKSICAGGVLDRKHRWGGDDYTSRPRKRVAAVACSRENDVISVGPYCVKRAIRTHGS